MILIKKSGETIEMRATMSQALDYLMSTITAQADSRVYLTESYYKAMASLLDGPPVFYLDGHGYSLETADDDEVFPMLIRSEVFLVSKRLKDSSSPLVLERAVFTDETVLRGFFRQYGRGPIDLHNVDTNRSVFTSSCFRFFVETVDGFVPSTDPEGL